MRINKEVRRKRGLLKMSNKIIRMRKQLELSGRILRKWGQQLLVMWIDTKKGRK
jgi:hypothetical protein